MGVEFFEFYRRTGTGFVHACGKRAEGLLFTFRVRIFDETHVTFVPRHKLNKTVPRILSNYFINSIREPAKPMLAAQKKGAAIIDSDAVELEAVRINGASNEQKPKNEAG